MEPQPITSEAIRAVTREVMQCDVSQPLGPAIREIAERTDGRAVGAPHFMQRFYYLRFRHYCGQALEMSLARGAHADTISALVGAFDAAPGLLFTAAGQRRLTDDIVRVNATEPDVATLMCMGVLDSHDLRCAAPCNTPP